MFINYCFPRERRKTFSEKTKYEIINNEIYHNHGISQVYFIEGKPKQCEKCKYFLICYVIKRTDLFDSSTYIFCTTKQCKKGFYKGE